MYHLFYILSKDIKRKNHITGTRMGRIKAKTCDFIEKTHTDYSDRTDYFTNTDGYLFEHG